MYKRVVSMREGMLASASSPLYNFRIRKCENVREDKLRDFLEGGRRFV